MQGLTATGQLSHRGNEQNMDNFRQQEEEDNELVSNFDFMNDKP